MPKLNENEKIPMRHFLWLFAQCDISLPQLCTAHINSDHQLLQNITPQYSSSVFYRWTWPPPNEDLKKVEIEIHETWKKLWTGTTPSSNEYWLGNCHALTLLENVKYILHFYVSNFRSEVLYLMVDICCCVSIIKQGSQSNNMIADAMSG